MKTLREILLSNNQGVVMMAAADFARSLNQGDPESLKAGYSQSNAILAAVEMFPEVTENEIRKINNWESPPNFAERAQ